MTWTGRLYRTAVTLTLLVFGSIFGLRWLAGEPLVPDQPKTRKSPPPGALEVTVGQGGIPRRVGMTWERVTRAGLGPRWPLTVDEAYVGCSRDLPMFSALIVVDGEPWALNGTTKGWARGGKYRLDVAGAWRTVRVTDEPEAWWAAGTDTPRKDIGPLV